jgi:hypothetical protein
LLRQIAGFVFDYIFTGKPRSLGGDHNAKLVEYGVARFGKMGHILGDEPLAILAAVHYFTNNTPWSLQYFLLEEVCTPNDTARGTALEHLGAYLLAAAFRLPRRLSDIFEFVGVSDLGNQRAHLVAIHQSSHGTLEYTPVDIFSSQQGTYILGHSARTEAETLSWLSDPKRVAFCFPAHTFGPDLILFLLLEDGTLLRVLLQFKYRSTMGPKATAEAYRTTDPSQFVSQLTNSGKPQARP